MAGFDWTFPQAFRTSGWQINGNVPGRVTAEVATFETLELTIRATSSTLTTALRPLKSNEGQVDVLVTDNGGFIAIDRANGENTFTVDPADRRKPLRQYGEYHVRRYEEELVSQEVGEWTVELELVRNADRTDAPSISETVETGEWGFTTRYGTIATDRVDADFLGTGADGVERFELTTRLTIDQAHVFEAALSLLAGQRTKVVPDAPNLAIDETSGDANTLTINSPSDAEVSDGDYVVTEWESRRITDAYQEVSVTIGQTA